MTPLSMDDLRPGMVVASPVLGPGGSLRLAAGFILDEGVIDQCRRIGIRSLWIREDGEEPPPDGLLEQIALQAKQAWTENMVLLRKMGDVQDVTLDSLKKFTSDKERFKDIVVSGKVKSLVDQIIKAILGQDSMVLNMANLRGKDEFLYQHALDVTITATMVAKKLKFILPEIQELAMGCFLMDIGAIALPQELQEKKPAERTPEEIRLFQEHPSVGFAILRANPGIPINAAHVAYQHHERQDGSGYPRGLKSPDTFPYKSLVDAGGAIHRYAQVAAVADRYISAISPRPGTVEPMNPLEAMRMLIAEAGKTLNSHVVNALITLIPVFPTGTRIVVTKAPHSFLVGHQGVVSRSNAEERERPQIILVADKFKRKIPPLAVDMAKVQGFEIQFAALAEDQSVPRANRPPQPNAASAKSL